MVRFYKPQTVLELGTSLGITTCYLARANPDATIITLEGATSVLNMAKQNFKEARVGDIRTIGGNFDDTLGPALDSNLTTVDFAFIDGNHRREPTIRYFESIISKTNSHSIIVLDDIHWSKEMEQAWKYCKEHPSVVLTIDLFFIGILIFRKEIKEKQHFVVRF
jgi:predicted O-methyltransferase YrrM